MSLPANLVSSRLLWLLSRAVNTGPEVEGVLNAGGGGGGRWFDSGLRYDFS